MPTTEAEDTGCARAAKARATSPTPAPLVLVAAVALIDADSRVLVCRRPANKSWAGWWEFPGGKVEAGETPEATVLRELREELAVSVVDSCLAPFSFASHAYDDCHLLMPLYLCRVWAGRPTPQEGQAIRWLRPNDLMTLDRLLPADRPLVAMLRDYI